MHLTGGWQIRSVLLLTETNVRQLLVGMLNESCRDYQRNEMSLVTHVIHSPGRHRVVTMQMTFHLVIQRTQRDIQLVVEIPAVT
jgi:hypothetical protein